MSDTTASETSETCIYDIDCYACQDSGIAYLSDGVYSACLECERAEVDGLVQQTDDGWSYTAEGQAMVAEANRSLGDDE